MMFCRATINIQEYFTQPLNCVQFALHVSWINGILNDTALAGETNMDQEVEKRSKEFLNLRTITSVTGKENIEKYV